MSRTGRGTSGPSDPQREENVFEYYFVNYQVRGADQLQVSRFSFPIWRALFLVEQANKHFKRAEHWVGDEDEELVKMHPNYGGEEWIDEPLTSWLD